MRGIRTPAGKFDKLGEQVVVIYDDKAGFRSKDIEIPDNMIYIVPEGKEVIVYNSLTVKGALYVEGSLLVI